MKAIPYIARAEALDIELEALFSELHEALTLRLRSDAFSWTMRYQRGQCTELLIESSRTQERFSGLSQLPVQSEEDRRRLRRLDERLSQYLGEISQGCDHAEDKAHGTLCTFQGHQGALDHVLLEVFQLESYASERIRLRLEVAKTTSLQDAVTIPLLLNWHDALGSLDVQEQLSRTWCREEPDAAWPWLLRHILIGLQGQREGYAGAEVMTGLHSIQAKVHSGALALDPFSKRSLNRAIGELSLFHERRTLDVSDEDERRYWEEPPHALKHALTWKIVSEVVARHIMTRDLSVFELHPGGGQGDTLSLRDMGGPTMYGEELNDFRAYRRLGSPAPKGQYDPFDNGGFYIRRALFTRDFESFIDDISKRCHLPHGQRNEDAIKHPKVLTYSVMATLLEQHLGGPLELEWRSAICDSSGQVGTRPRRAFDASGEHFKTILKATKVPDSGLSPLYGLWMLVERHERNPPRDEVLLVLEPERAKAWIRSKGKHPKALDLHETLKREKTLSALAGHLWSKRLHHGTTKHF